MRAAMTGAMAALAGGAVAAALRRAWRSPLPQVSGSLRLDGLEHTVTVERDRWGVPHVSARSAGDAAHAMGFLHAQDRLFQLDLGRRVASGRLAEIAGEEGVASDRYVRRLGLRRWAERDRDAVRGEPLEVLERYAAGVNAGIAAGRLPVEFRLLRTEPEPWTAVDSLLAARLLDVSLALNWDIEAQRLELVQAIGAERAARLDLVYPEHNPTILRRTARSAGDVDVDAALEMYRAASAWLPAQVAGSNSWVVDGSMTATGRPLLANDPHLTPLVPSVWYETHVRAGDDFESAGVTLPGLPFVVIGHNERIAWGYTNSFADVQDLVIEEFDDLHATHHRTEDGWQPSEHRTEEIRVRGRPSVLEDVVTTRHGPLVEPPRRGADGVVRGLALQWTSNRPSTGVRWLLRIQRARGWDDFREAHRDLLGPSLNATYADVDGHIGYLLCGVVPVRRSGASGLPRPGWTGEATWERVLDPDDLPHLLDPTDHHLVTANNRVVGDAFPHHISHDYMNGYRAARIEELLAGRSGLTVEDMQRIQVDTVCPPARELGALLADVTISDERAERARTALVAWDGDAAAGAVEPVLYECVVQRLMQHALEPLCGEHWRILAGTGAVHPVFDYPGNIIGRVLPNILQRWRRGDGDMLDGRTTWDEVARRALEDGARDAEEHRGAPWGRVHALTLQHPLVRGVPALGPLLNAGTVELGGNVDTVMATCYSPAAPFRTTLWTPSWRQVLDVGDWDRSTGVHLPGQSGHPSSPHYRDLVPEWHANRQHPLCWTPDAVADHAEAYLTLLAPGAP